MMNSHDHNSTDSYSSNNSTQEQQQAPKKTEWTGIDMSNKQIRSLSPSIARFSFLTVIHLQNNNLETLPVELFTLSALTYLDLSCNLLTYISPLISNLKQLKNLSLFQNKISIIPIEMGRLFRLKKLALEGNPISNIPIPILQGGAMTLIPFLRDSLQVPPRPRPRKWGSNNNLNIDDDVIQSSEKIRVMCYNILADSYANNDTLIHTPHWSIAWNYRKKVILEEIQSSGADFICLQEVEKESYLSFFLPEMIKLGYDGVYKQKSRSRTMEDANKVDGCVIFYKAAKFVVVQEHLMEYQSIALQKHAQLTSKQPADKSSGLSRLINKDNIGLILLMKYRKNGHDIPNSHFWVVNTHIFWDPSLCDVKLIQSAFLLQKLSKLNAKENYPMIICGDFNSQPRSGVVKLILEGRVESDEEDFLFYDFGEFSKNGLEHSLKLRSSYLECLGEEPEYTNYTADFIGTLDYIFYTDNSIQAVKVLDVVDSKDIIDSYGVLPNPHLPSDHVSLLADFIFHKKPESDIESDRGGIGIDESNWK